MKILILISEIKYSGAAKISSWLANKLCGQAYDISFLTFIDGKDRQYLDSKISRISICKGVTNKYFRTIKAIYEVHKILRREKYDLLISFLPLEGLISVLGALFTNTKVIVSERSDPYHEKSFIANISRFMFQFADGAVFQSDGAKEYYPLKLQNRSAIIANPIAKTTAQIVPYKEREDLIVSSSRLEIKQKRQDVLLKAFEIVSHICPNTVLKLIGDGPDEDNLKKLATSLGISDKVKFVGRSDSVIRDISNAKLYVFSSDFEGMPNSVLEALSIGLPVVTTDYSPGGAKELIQNKHRGYVVPTGDYEYLAEKIIYLLENNTEGKIMAENALTISEELSEDAIIDSWKSYIQKIVG